MTDIYRKFPEFRELITTMSEEIVYSDDFAHLWRMFLKPAFYMYFFVDMSLICDCFCGSIRRVRQLLSHGISFEFNAIGRLDESIQEGIGNRWIGHILMPVFDG